MSPQRLGQFSLRALFFLTTASSVALGGYAPYWRLDCVEAPPGKPSPARIRHSLQDATPAERQKMLNPSNDDLESMVLLADHEFLVCGGPEVGRLYEGVLHLEPNHVRANLGFGEWLVLNGQLNESTPYLEIAVAHAVPNSPELMQGRSVLRYVKYKLKSVDGRR